MSVIAMRQRFRHRGLLPFGLGVLAILVFAARLMAQEPGESGPPPAIEEPAGSRAGVQTPPVLPGETFPQVFHLRDGDGKLWAVPNFRYEDFMELLKVQRQLGGQEQLPPYSIENLTLTGTASAASAELVAKATISVHEAGWVGVPLRLNDAVLRDKPAYAGPGDHVLDVHPAGDGHVVWIRSQADQTHEVTFRLAVAVEQVGTQSRLKLSAPLAAVSQLQLQVPLARAVAKVSEGATLDAVRPLAGGKTELRAIGLTGDFELSWHPADSPVASLPTILAVTTEQTITMNGRSVSTEATLSVRSLGSEFDHFQVRLPPGADYIGPSQPGVSLVALDAAAADGKLYEVTLDKKTAGPVDVHLVTERTHNSTQGDEMLQLAGFDVPGARRQSGYVDVRVEGNWQIVWGETNHVRTVDDAEVRRGARFEYFDQPYSLAARVVEQTTRVRVEPQYVLLVGGEEVRLQARLKYTIRGAKKRSLEVALRGWDVDQVGPASLVDVNTTLAGVGESLDLTLLQETNGEFEVTLEARRRIDSGADRIELPLPAPQDEVLAADVAIVSDDNVELLPLADEIEGLTAQTVRPQMTLPERQQEPLHYHASGAAAQFVAAMKLHKQAISSAITTQLEVGPDTIDVEARIAFEVAYQPTDHLTLSVPRSIRLDRMTVLYEGQRIEPVPLRPGLLSDESATLAQVNLPAPRTGRCELQIRYTLAHEKPPAESSRSTTVPLVTPAEGRLTSNHLAVVPAAGIAVNYPSGSWSEEKVQAVVPGGPTLALIAQRALAAVTLAVTSEQAPAQSSTIVERAWIRSHLTKNARQDRAVFRLATSQDRVQVRLPAGVDMRSLLAEVDAIRVEPESVQQHAVTIPLGGGLAGEHLLELRYQFTARPAEGSLALAGPQIPAASWVEQLYWQLVLPADEEVLFPPSVYTEENSWAWSDYFWRRRPTLSHRDLQNWIAAGMAGSDSRVPAMPAAPYSPSDPFAAGATNQFLYSSVGAVEPLVPYTIGRAQLVLLASLPTLLCGLVLIYFAPVRHPAVLFALAILLAAGSFVAPRTALLLAQASVLGLALACVAALLARMLPRRPPATIPVRESSQALRERSITERYQRPAASSSAGPPSTATGPPLVPTSPEG